MPDIIYDVAVSVDGFIADTHGGAAQFPHEGDHVAAYMARLQSYKTVLMGRATYEFGYAFGLEPGQNPYPWAQVYVCSATLNLPGAEVTVLPHPDKRAIEAVRDTSDGPVYLCGGGAFAGWMLRQGLIDRLILKHAPVFLGAGIPLFGADAPPSDWQVTDTQTHENGVITRHYSALRS